MHLYKKKLINSFNFYSFIWQVTDALRISISIILPVALLCLFNLSFVGIPVGIGSLLISLVDNTDVWKEKKRIFQTLVISFFIISFVVSIAWPHQVILGMIIFLFSFGFSIIHAYGKRWATAGSVCIVLVIFVIAFKPVNAFLFSLFVTIGTIWSFLTSFLFYRLSPFRSANQIVSECMVEIGKFMYDREKLYDCDVPLKDAYKSVIAGHEMVNAKQEMLRLLILSDEKIIALRGRKCKNLLSISIILIDLYERIRVMPLDYGSLREKLTSDELLLIRNYVKSSSLMLISLGVSKSKMHSTFDQSNQFYRPSQFSKKIEKHTVDQIGSKKEIFGAVVRNINEISARIESLHHLIYETNRIIPSCDDGLNLIEFVDSQKMSISEAWKHITFKSKIFRFAMRTAIAITIAYAITQIFALGHYSYWVMLTVALVLRPTFSITQTRNLARLKGTLIGIIAGLIFTFLLNVLPLKIIALGVCLSGFFYFLQTSYATSVSFITPFIIIGLSFTGNDQSIIASERIYDTLLGCIVSFVACFILPDWEVDSLKKGIDDLLNANLNLIESKLLTLKSGAQNLHHYKLSRKTFYSNSAKFTEMLKRINFEPKKIDIKQEVVEQFVILNYLLYSSVSAVEIRLPDTSNFISYEMLASAIEKTVKSLKAHCLTPKDSHTQFVFAISNDFAGKALVYNDQSYEDWQTDYVHYLTCDLVSILNYMRENYF